jgi:hypothetical protein
MKIFSAFVGVVLILVSCKKTSTIFTSIPARDSHIDFINQITEYDTFNILNTEFIYNGAGIAIGDLNGDTLEDLYFAGNQVENKCYLNTGNFEFKDITNQAHLQKYPDSGLQESILLISMEMGKMIFMYAIL